MNIATELMLNKNAPPRDISPKNYVSIQKYTENSHGKSILYSGKNSEKDIQILSYGEVSISRKHRLSITRPSILKKIILPSHGRARMVLRECKLNFGLPT